MRLQVALIAVLAIKINNMNITSITVVLNDGTVWSAEGTAFSQVAVPTAPEIIDVPLDTPVELHAA